jgi:hypothetical protein
MGGVPPAAGRWGGRLVPTHVAWVATTLNLWAFKPPYLPALGGRAGTFPPFDFVSGGTDSLVFGTQAGEQVGQD